MAGNRYEVPDYTFPLFQQQVATGRDEIASILQRLLAEMAQQQSERESVRGAETQRMGMAANIAGPLAPGATLGKLAGSIPSGGFEELVPIVQKQFEQEQQQALWKQGAQGIGVRDASNKYDAAVAGGGIESSMKKGIEAVNAQVQELSGTGATVIRVQPRISTKDFDAAISLATGPLKKELEDIKFSEYGSTFLSIRAKDEELSQLTSDKHQLKRDWLRAQWDVRKTKPFQDRLTKLNSLAKLYGVENAALEKILKSSQAKVEAAGGKGDLGQLISGKKAPKGSRARLAYEQSVKDIKAEDETDLTAAEVVVEDLRAKIGDLLEIKMQERFQVPPQGPSTIAEDFFKR